MGQFIDRYKESKRENSYGVFSMLVVPFITFILLFNILQSVSGNDFSKTFYPQVGVGGGPSEELQCK